jgi:peptide deformylase
MSNLSLQTGRKNEILRTVSSPIKMLDSETKKFIQKMLKTIKADSNAVGLAAPQVGKNIRLIISKLGNKFFVMINPVITHQSEEKVCDEEGCLSIPGEFGKVWRSQNIDLEFLDEKLQKKKLKLQDFNARIVLHEVDHLDGILFVDRMTDEHLGEMHAEKIIS